MRSLPASFPAYLHGMSIVAVPVCMLALVAWEHPFLVIMMLPVAAIALLVHATATVTSLRALRRSIARDGFAHATSAATAIAAPLGAVVAWVNLETFPIMWWAGALALGLLHLAAFMQGRVAS